MNTGDIARLLTEGEDLFRRRKHPVQLRPPKRGPHIIISPELSAKVMAMSPAEESESPFFVSPDAIRKPDLARPYHPEGGHRWWPLPEGQKGWSLYFPQGTTDFTMENWRVPHSFDKAAFQITEQDIGSAKLRAFISMINSMGTNFDTIVDLDYRMLACPDGCATSAMLAEDVKHVGYSQKIKFTNDGRQPWNSEYGMIAPWSMAMLRSGEQAWIVMPTRRGRGDEIVDYGMGTSGNGEVPSSRFLLRDDYALMKADGRYRGKKGLRPHISTGSIAAIDLERGWLTVMHVPVSRAGRYLDNRWEPETRYQGTAIDCYNDSGDIAAGGKESMFEIEGVCPVRTISPGNSLSFTVKLHHFQLTDASNIGVLYEVLRNLAGVNLNREQYRA